MEKNKKKETADGEPSRTTDLAQFLKLPLLKVLYSPIRDADKNKSNYYKKRYIFVPPHMSIHSDIFAALVFPFLFP